jgi:hypothetical protein
MVCGKNRGRRNHIIRTQAIRTGSPLYSSPANRQAIFHTVPYPTFSKAVQLFISSRLVSFLQAWSQDLFSLRS